MCRCSSWLSLAFGRHISCQAGQGCGTAKCSEMEESKPEEQEQRLEDLKIKESNSTSRQNLRQCILVGSILNSWTNTVGSRNLKLCGRDHPPTASNRYLPPHYPGFNQGFARAYGQHPEHELWMAQGFGLAVSRKKVMWDVSKVWRIKQIHSFTHFDSWRIFLAEKIFFERDKYRL